jgi:hypothetical protein
MIPWWLFLVSPPLVIAAVINTTSPRASVGGSPLADHTAIAAMAAGDTNPDPPQLDKGNAWYANERLGLFKERTGKKAVKLTQTSVFSFLHQGFIKALITDLLEARCSPARSSQLVRKTINFFDTTTYTRQMKVEPGKSCRIAGL